MGAMAARSAGALCSANWTQELGSRRIQPREPWAVKDWACIGATMLCGFSGREVLRATAGGGDAFMTTELRSTVLF